MKTSRTCPSCRMPAPQHRLPDGTIIGYCPFCERVLEPPGVKQPRSDEGS